jgi:hypothetical protein
LGLAATTPVADASHWLCLQARPSHGALGQLLATEPFMDATALRAWLSQQVIDRNCLLATGQFMPATETVQWQRELELDIFGYRAGRAYYDSQSGAVLGEFLRSDRQGSLLHLNRDPSGRYSAMLLSK